MSLEILRRTWSSACGRRDVRAEIVEGEDTIEFRANGTKVASVARKSVSAPGAPGVIVGALEQLYPVSQTLVHRDVEIS